MRLAEEFIIPARQGRAFVVRRGQVFRIFPMEDGQVGDCVFYNAHDYGRASAAGVVTVLGTIIIATFALRTVSSLFREGGT